MERETLTSEIVMNNPEGSVEMMKNQPEVFWSFFDTIGRRSLSRTTVAELKLPRGVDVIEPEACINNDHITVVDARFVKYIGDRAFAHCKNLETIYLPQNLTMSAGDKGPFYGCSNVKKIAYCDENGKVAQEYVHDPYSFID